MTTLNINTEAFNDYCEAERATFLALTKIGTIWKETAADYRQYLKINADDIRKTWKAVAPKPVATKTATEKALDLQAQLRSASRAAGLAGASDAQISLIVNLAKQQNDFNILSGGRLTKGEASIIINEMKR